MQPKPHFETDLAYIAAKANEKEEENDHFLRFVHSSGNIVSDDFVHSINDIVSAAIDCTACGNCCRSLVINVARGEVALLADHLCLTVAETKEMYIEESQGGNCFINTMPCHFLRENKCTIYENRFRECRDFPHLHKPGFKDRLAGTLMHYGRCPIIFNVIEIMKSGLGFFE